MRLGAISGFILIIIGVGLFAYYDKYVKPEKDAMALLVEGKIILEEGNKETINNSRRIFSRVIAQYPASKAANEAYYYIGLGYEKLGLNRLAYLKYLYVLKNNRLIDDKSFIDKNKLYKSKSKVSDELKRKIVHRLARLKLLRMQTDEGVHQLLSLLNYSTNKDFRSKVYAELGYTYLKKRYYKKAHRMFDISHHEDSSNEDAILGKARALKKLGHHHRAYSIYEYFLKYYGDYSQYTKDVMNSYIRQVYHSGYYSYRKGRYKTSISFFKRLLRFYPNIKRSENSLYWIGESYLALGHYNSALKYFNRVISNSYYHKNQDARMKKGYTYFVYKKYDLAAREFQKYMRDYPRGKHNEAARKWKRICSKEISHRINNRSIPKMYYKDDLEEEEKHEFRRRKKRKNPTGVNSDSTNDKTEDVELENVAEL